MRMPALPQSKRVVEKKSKDSFWKSIRTSLMKRFSKKQRFLRIPPRD